MTDTPQRRGHPRDTPRVLTALGRIELTLGSLALLAILVLVFLQALQRYLPIDQIAWTGEVARFSLVWLTFSVAGWLVTARGHIALEIADALPSPKAVRAVQTFALLIVAVTGVGLTVEAWALVTTQGIIKSPVLRLPMSWVYVPVLLGAASTAVRAALAAVDIARHGPWVDEALSPKEDAA